MEMAEVRTLALAGAARIAGSLRDALLLIGVGGVDLRTEITNGLLRSDLRDVDCALVALDALGLDFIRQTRRDPACANPYLPIIAVVAAPRIDTVRAAINAGAHEVLTWPLSGEQVRQRLLRVLLAGRPFIKTEDYFGPCRRRSAQGWAGAERRAGAEAERLARFEAELRIQNFFDRDALRI